MLTVAVLPGRCTWHSSIRLKGSLVAFNSIPIYSKSELLRARSRSCGYCSKRYVPRNSNENCRAICSRCLVLTAIRQECRLMPDLSHLSDAKRILLEKYMSGNAVRSREGKPQITSRPRGNTAPLSLAQEQVWLHGQMA